MKPRYILGLMCLVVGIVFVLAFNKALSAGAAQPTRAVPTAAPTPTPGPVPTMVSATPVPLTDPLVTPEQALAWAKRFDDATWDEPWTLATLTSDPSRITLQLLPNENAAGYGLVAPEAAEAVGPVWKITIRGTVHSQGFLPMYSLDSPLAHATCDGMVYVFAQRSGMLVATAAGLTRCTPAPTP